jgi:hypothetical protein
MAGLTKKQNVAFSEENLTGRTQQIYFNPTEEENFTYYGSVDVDFNKRTSIDAEKLQARQLNQQIRDAMKKGYGTIVIKNPAYVYIKGKLNNEETITCGFLTCYFNPWCLWWRKP